MGDQYIITSLFDSKVTIHSRVKMVVELVRTGLVQNNRFVTAMTDGHFRLTAIGCVAGMCAKRYLPYCIVLIDE